MLLQKLTKARRKNSGRANWGRPMAPRGQNREQGSQNRVPQRPSNDRLIAGLLMMLMIMVIVMVMIAKLGGPAKKNKEGAPSR
jgi:hypothetical protein